MNALPDTPGVTLTADYLLSLRHRARRMPSPSLSDNTLPGGMVNRRRGRGLEAADIRHFVEGDDVRLIDRNATARTGELHVRTLHDERDRTALLMADFRPSMLWGTRRAFRSVAAAEALTLLGWRIVAAGGRVALMAFGAGEPVIVPPRGRDRGMIAVIGGLVRAHRLALDRTGVSDGPLTDTLDLARRVTPMGSSVFLASALDDPGDLNGTAGREAFGALDHRCPLTVLRIRDAFEVAAPEGTYPFRLATGETRVARLREPDRLDDADRILRDWRIDVIDLDASQPLRRMADTLGHADVG